MGGDGGRGGRGGERERDTHTHTQSSFPTSFLIYIDINRPESVCAWGGGGGGGGKKQVTDC